MGWGMALSIGPSKTTSGREPSDGASSSAKASTRAPKAAVDGRVAELEDGGADLGDGRIEIFNCFADPVYDYVQIPEPHRALQRHADGKDPLDHPIVEVAGDSVAVIEQAEHSDLFV